MFVDMTITGIPIVFDKPHQPITFIANGSDYRFDIAFMNQGNTPAKLENVEYNIVILKDEKEIFDAQNQSSSPSSPLLTSTGNATIHHEFENTGSVLGTSINSRR